MLPSELSVYQYFRSPPILTRGSYFLASNLPFSACLGEIKRREKEIRCKE
jgi:hypothetical protein